MFCDVLPIYIGMDGIKGTLAECWWKYISRNITPSPGLLPSHDIHDGFLLKIQAPGFSSVAAAATTIILQYSWPHFAAMYVVLELP